MTNRKLLPNSPMLSILAGMIVVVSLVFAADSRAATIGAGPFQSCGISPSGALSCWGADNQGVLGTGENRPDPSYDPLPVQGLGSGVTDISMDNTACAIVSGGVRCWGNNSYGELGNGTTGGESNTPVQVSGLESGVTKIAVNEDHVCAIHNAAAKCWGSGDGRRLGNGSAVNRSSPTPVTGLGSGVTDIAAGWRHTCGIKDGTIFCWGNNTNSQLGHGGTNNEPQALDSPPPGQAIRIAAGVDLSCALMDSGAVYCWGSNGEGKLGAGKVYGNPNTDPGALYESVNPLPVTGMDSGVTEIHANSQHACAIKSGTAFCWGDGRYGQLGNGATTAGEGNSSNVPVQVSNISGVTSIATGTGHTCAVASSKQYCWGDNRQRQLGSNRVGEFSGVPVEVTGTAAEPDPGPTDTQVEQALADDAKSAAKALKGLGLAKLLAKGKLKAPVEALEAGDFTAKLKGSAASKKAVTILKGNASFAGAGTGDVELKLTKKGEKLLKKAKKAKDAVNGTLQLTFSADDGNSATQGAKVKLK